MGFPTRSDIKQAVQPQKMAGSLIFQILGEEGLYYPCSENKGADQLHRYSEVDLRLVFAYAKSRFFLMTWLNISRLILRWTGTLTDCYNPQQAGEIVPEIKLLLVVRFYIYLIGKGVLSRENSFVFSLTDFLAS